MLEDIDFVSVFIFWIDFGTVLTAWYFCFSFIIFNTPHVVIISVLLSIVRFLGFLISTYAANVYRH